MDRSDKKLFAASLRDEANLASKMRHGSLAHFLSLLPRLLAGVSVALIAGYFIHPLYALGWFAVLIGSEAAFNKFWVARVVDPLWERQPEKAQGLMSIPILFIASVILAGWAPAWVLSGSPFDFIGAILFASTLLHALIYCSASRTNFLACVGPVTLFVFGFLIFRTESSVPTLLVVALAFVLLLEFVLGVRDREQLGSAMAREASLRRSAEEESEAKSRFLAVMSHELRTPLNAVIGYAELLEEDLSERGDDLFAKDAGAIHLAAKNLLVLIDDVLRYAESEGRQPTLDVELTDVHALLLENLAEAKVWATKNNNKIHLEVAPEVSVHMLDAGRLHTCVRHLISNACKFTVHGDIAVIAKLEGPEAETLSVTVQDSGCGIAAADANRLFQPFVQIDSGLTRDQDGAGMGLALSRAYAKAMGGNLVLEPSVRGARFKLTVHVARVRKQAMAA